MKKIARILSALLILSVLLCGCKNEREITPTGGWSTGVPKTLVYHDSHYYYNDPCNQSILEELPKGCALLGKIFKNDDNTYPQEELHAAHLKEGYAVYQASDRDELYVCESDTRIYVMIRYTKDE